MGEVEEQYIMLNINEKIEKNFFNKPNLFFKIANLNSQKPFVQIGNHVFSGEYQDGYHGTTLFFEEQDEPVPCSIYEKTTPINLKCIGKVSKVLSLRWQKIPDEIVDVDKSELLELHFRENYATVLSKIDAGTLDIRDITAPANKNENVETIDKIKKKKREERIEEEEEMEEEVENEEPESLDEKYKLLKKITVPPVNQPEYYNKVVDGFSNDIEFSILKEIYLKSLDYQKLALNFDENNIQLYVDIEASVRDGIIQQVDIKALKDHDKQALISLNNFDNLATPLKLTLLIEYLKCEKKAISEMSATDLETKDEFGRTPKHRYRLLKSLAKDLQYLLFLKCRDNKR